MAYLTKEQINKIGFCSVGENVLISDKAIFYRPERITIGNNVRIDDFVVLANTIILHNNIHIALKSSILSSSHAAIEMEDYTALSYHCLLFAETDDYSQGAFINPTVPDEYRNIAAEPILLKKFSSVGANATVMPGSILEEGAVLGAGSVLKSVTKPWFCYFGVPARAIGKRNKEALEEAYAKLTQQK